MIDVEILDRKLDHSASADTGRHHDRDVAIGVVASVDRRSWYVLGLDGRDGLGGVTRR